MKTIVKGGEVVRWVSDRLNNGELIGNAEGLGLADDGMLCAGVVFNNYQKHSACIHVASDGTKQWMNRHFLWCVFDYAFNQLGVNVLIGLVSSENHDALRFDENLGFEEEHRIKGAHESGDLVILTMRREDCRFLELKVAYG